MTVRGVGIFKVQQVEDLLLVTETRDVIPSLPTSTSLLAVNLQPTSARHSSSASYTRPAYLSVNRALELEAIS